MSVDTAIRNLIIRAWCKLPLSISTKLKGIGFIQNKEQNEALEDFNATFDETFGFTFRLYDKIKEECPNFAKWATPERLEQLQGGAVTQSFAVLGMSDYFTPEKLDLFYLTYIKTDEMNNAFSKFWIAMGHQAKAWGYFKDSDTLEGTSNITDPQEIVNLHMQISHELTKFLKPYISTSSYDETHATITRYFTALQHLHEDDL